MTTSKSPLAVARWALLLGKTSLPPYSHERSPHKYTQPQLFALLVLKEFFGQDYRGLMAMVSDLSDLQRTLELQELPHYTTVQKAARRLLSRRRARKLLAASISAAKKGRILRSKRLTGALDSTGLSSHHTSAYFVERKQRILHVKGYQTTHYQRFPKLAHICDIATHLIFGFLPSWGPSTDVSHFAPLLKEGLRIHPVGTILADAGYDSEANHRFAREELGVKSIIPARAGRSTTKLPTGFFRRRMRTHFPKKTYGQRAQAEAVMSMLKRNFGEALSARTYQAQMREIGLKVLTHNIGILLFA
jgi:transposase